MGYADAVGGIPQRPTVLGVYDGFCKGANRGMFCLYGGLPELVLLTEKGGHARSRRRAVIGLDLRLGPIPKEVWTSS